MVLSLTFYDIILVLRLYHYISMFASKAKAVLQSTFGCKTACQEDGGVDNDFYYKAIIIIKFYFFTSAHPCAYAARIGMLPTPPSS